MSSHENTLHSILFRKAPGGAQNRYLVFNDNPDHTRFLSIYVSYGADPSEILLYRSQLDAEEKIQSLAELVSASVRAPCFQFF